MSNYFFKDNRIRFFNLALFMVLLSLTFAWISKIDQEMTHTISQLDTLLLSLTHITMFSTWVYMSIRETMDYLKKRLSLCYIEHPILDLPKKIQDPLSKKIMFIFNDQHQHMVMRC